MLSRKKNVATILQLASGCLKKWDMVEQGFSLMNLVMNDLQVQKTFLHLAQ